VDDAFPFRNKPIKKKPLSIKNNQIKVKSLASLNLLTVGDIGFNHTVLKQHKIDKLMYMEITRFWFANQQVVPTT
jgi:hypothetical protein